MTCTVLSHRVARCLACSQVRAQPSDPEWFRSCGRPGRSWTERPRSVTNEARWRPPSTAATGSRPPRERMIPASGRHAGRPSASAAQAPTRKAVLSAGPSPVNARLTKPRLAKRAPGSIKTDNKNGYRSGGGRDRVSRAVGRASSQAPLIPAVLLGYSHDRRPPLAVEVPQTTVGGLLNSRCPCSSCSPSSSCCSSLRACRREGGCYARVPPHTEMPELEPLRGWLNRWSGIGVIAAGMARQGCDLQLTRYVDEGLAR